MFFSRPNGSAENIFEGFLAVRTDLPKTFLKVFAIPALMASRLNWLMEKLATHFGRIVYDGNTKFSGGLCVTETQKISGGLYLTE